MRITNNFNLSEFTRTNTGLPNKPNKQEIDNIIALVKNIIQPVRDKLNIPIIVTSGFRSEAVNNKVGGKPTSYHRYGMAADLKCSNNKLLFDTLREMGGFSELIYEFGNHLQPQWVHVAYDGVNISGTKVLKAYKDRGVTKYKRI